MSGSTSGRRPPGDRALALTILSIAASASLAVALVAVYLSSGSLMALGQAADSITDFVVGGLLVVAVVIGRRPPDRDHHFGHNQAQPIAALVAAVLAGILGFGVVREAALALWQGETATLTASAAVVFAAKAGLKAVVASLAIAARRRRRSSALDALIVDALADIGVGLVALAGYAGVELGYPSLDAWLALPIGLYVLAAALLLARRNVQLLMGAAPSAEALVEIRRIITGVDGVGLLEDLRVREHGAGIEVAACIAVDPALTIAEAHRVAEAVEAALIDSSEATQVLVHVHPLDGKKREALL
jgi:cation diffusion facilitator family transporter